MSKQSYVFVDAEEYAVDEEDREIRVRRLFMYSEDALIIAESVELIHVAHDDFKHGLLGFDRVFQLSRRLQTPNGVLLLGATGTGKTTLIRYFVGSLPQSSLFEAGSGAIAIRLQHRPTPGSTISVLLAAIKYPFPQVNANTIYQKRDVLIDALKQKGTRELLVDESQHLATQVRYRGVSPGEHTKATDLLCQLMDEAGLGLVLCARDGFDLEHVDPALASRVSVRLQLRNFPAGAAWTGFVRAFCKASKRFDLSFLESDEQCGLLHLATDGNLRSFKRLVTEAVLVAVDQGAQKLTAEVLSLAFERVQGRSTPRINPYAERKAA